MTDYNLSALSSRSFEQLIQAIAVKVIGPGIAIFGDGPDGGREATFEGRIPFPSTANQWNGYGIIQAKFKQRGEGAETDGKWAAQQLRKELSNFTKRGPSSRRPDYYIFATNIVLTPVQTTGSKDKLISIFEEFAPQIGIKSFDIWDYDKIRTFLDNYADLRQANAAWITPGDVLSEIIDKLRSASFRSEGEVVDIVNPGPSDSKSGLDTFMQRVDHHRATLPRSDQSEVEIMVARIRELQRQQRLFGQTTNREAQIWELVYHLNQYFFDHFGISLLYKSYS